MTGFWNAIQSLFVDFLLGPYDALRFVDNWWLSNIVSWVFIAIGLVAFTYWMKQLKAAADNGEEDKTNSSHSYL